MKSEVKPNIIKKIVKMAISYMVVIALASKGGYELHRMIVAKNEVPLEQRPVINKQARIDYNNGSLTKDKAVSEISAQLDLLVDTQNITSWNYYEDQSEFRVVLNNGTKFIYRLG